jgi:hypothetical protein
VVKRIINISNADIDGNSGIAIVKVTVSYASKIGVWSSIQTIFGSFVKPYSVIVQLKNNPCCGWST